MEQAVFFSDKNLIQTILIDTGQGRWSGNVETAVARLAGKDDSQTRVGDHPTWISPVA